MSITATVEWSGGFVRYECATVRDAYRAIHGEIRSAWAGGFCAMGCIYIDGQWVYMLTSTDTTGRYDVDTFAVVMPSTSSAEYMTHTYFGAVR